MTISTATFPPSAHQLRAQLLSIAASGTGAGLAATGAFADWIIPNVLAIGRHGSSRYDIHFVGTAAALATSIPAGSNIIQDLIETPAGSKIYTDTVRISLEDSGLATNPESMVISVVAEAACNFYHSGITTVPGILAALQSPNDFLSLIVRRNVLSVNDQKGIVGELKLLKELILRCDVLGLHHSRALAAWTGGNRDFSKAGTCVEVKASGGIERIHHVSNIDQLSQGPGEKALFVYSASAQIDYSHHKRLPEHVDDVLTILSRAFHGMFLTRLQNYRGVGVGYDHAKRPEYSFEPPFNTAFTSEIYAVIPPMEPLIRASFDCQEACCIGKKLPCTSVPSNVIEIKYKLNLAGLVSITGAAREAVLDSLL